ncbi:hypothetical protein E2C01_010508 [Portunus trituberculatus]|uniref:Uncharacterized protein n=1 Tax=Portunus trituberculatus TaxID=210409 RepID=A0A5B7D8N7_PORTR|nr:hypothetical protein [Portunus trituberculatus]
MEIKKQVRSSSLLEKEKKSNENESPRKTMWMWSRESLTWSLKGEGREVYMKVVEGWQPFSSTFLSRGRCEASSSLRQVMSLRLTMACR